MRLAVLTTFVAACGGSTPPPAAPVEEPKQRTRTEPVSDEEPEDGVEILSTRGRMDPQQVDAALAPHKDALFDCYMSRVGRRRWLGGHVALQWDISKAGEITAVRLAESDLGAWQVEKCMLEIARAAAFPAPKGGDADFSVPLDFKPTARATAWDEDMSLRAVGGQLAKLDDCAKAKGVTSLPRDVTITVYVGPQGKAQSVGFASPKSVLEDAWGDCAEKAALAWRLPDPKGTIAKLAVRYRAN